MGLPCGQNDMVGIDNTNCCYGTFSLAHPMEYGIVKNWDDMEKVWNHAFNQLRVEPKDYPVLLTEAVLNPKSNREKMAQVNYLKCV